VDGTGSHGWTAVALLWLHAHVLGVTELGAPPAMRLRIAPDDGGLPFARGRTFTSHGAVSVDWVPSMGQLSCELPDSSVTEIVRPPTCRGALMIQSVPPGGKVTASSATQATVMGAGVWVLTC
jgi:hypothetical protein